MYAHRRLSSAAFSVMDYHNVRHFETDLWQLSLRYDWIAFGGSQTHRLQKCAMYVRLEPRASRQIATADVS